MMSLEADPVYFWYVAIPTMLMSMAVQAFLRSTFSKWSGVRNTNGLTGLHVGQQLFERTTLRAIPLEPIAGALTDHFDPGANVVRLSEPVAGQPSVAAMAVAAHELGHVQQYQTRSALIGMRQFLIPALKISPNVSYLAIMLGLSTDIVGLIWIGIFFFALMVLFSLLTLPVEIDASRRAMGLLREAGLLQSDDDARGARRVLTAAALTYLASAISSVMQLFYYISLTRRRRYR